MNVALSLCISLTSFVSLSLHNIELKNIDLLQQNIFISFIEADFLYFMLPLLVV